MTGTGKITDLVWEKRFTSIGWCVRPIMFWRKDRPLYYRNMDGLRFRLDLESMYQSQTQTVLVLTFLIFERASKFVVNSSHLSTERFVSFSFQFQNDCLDWDEEHCCNRSDSMIDCSRLQPFQHVCDRSSTSISDIALDHSYSMSQSPSAMSVGTPRRRMVSWTLLRLFPASFMVDSVSVYVFNHDHWSRLNSMVWR